MMSEATKAFVDLTVDAHPELEHLRRQHLDENYGEMLPHLWTSDLARYVVERYRTGGSAAVQSLLSTLDAEAGSKPEVDEMIGVSFVEVLPYPGEAGAEVTRHLGPRLAHMLHEQRD
jgi:hypothetical protein